MLMYYRNVMFALFSTIWSVGYKTGLSSPAVASVHPVCSVGQEKKQKKMLVASLLCAAEMNTPNVDWHRM